MSKILISIVVSFAQTLAVLSVRLASSLRHASDMKAFSRTLQVQ